MIWKGGGDAENVVGVGAGEGSAVLGAGGNGSSKTVGQLSSSSPQQIADPDHVISTQHSLGLLRSGLAGVCQHVVPVDAALESGRKVLQHQLSPDCAQS